MLGPSAFYKAITPKITLPSSGHPGALRWEVIIATLTREEGNEEMDPLQILLLPRTDSKDRPLTAGRSAQS